jgi:hypothetical protein
MMHDRLVKIIPEPAGAATGKEMCRIRCHPQYAGVYGNNEPARKVDPLVHQPRQIEYRLYIFFVRAAHDKV